MSTLYIGIDNGVTGSIGMLDGGGSIMMVRTPVKKELSYTKKKQNITRINAPKLLMLFEDSSIQYENTRAMVERPFVNPGMFKSTLSAMRALEATLNVLEILSIGYEYIDSKEWQGALLPKGIKGTPDLKKASAQIGCRLYPSQATIINKQKDADGLLIAHYLMTKYNQK